MVFPGCEGFDGEAPDCASSDRRPAPKFAPAEVRTQIRNQKCAEAPWRGTRPPQNAGEPQETNGGFRRLSRRAPGSQ